MQRKTILAVDDEVHILELLKYNLETNDYDVITVETGEEALHLLSEEKIIVERLCQNAGTTFFYAQSPDFHKPRLCYYPKFLYL